MAIPNFGTAIHVKNIKKKNDYGISIIAHTIVIIHNISNTYNIYFNFISSN
jgi:hypothetical protein